MSAEPPVVEIYDSERRALAKPRFLKSLKHWFESQAVWHAAVLLDAAKFVNEQAAKGHRGIYAVVRLDEPPDDRLGLLDDHPFSVVVTSFGKSKVRFEVVEDTEPDFEGVGRLTMPGVACPTQDDERKLRDELFARMKADLEDNEGEAEGT